MVRIRCTCYMISISFREPRLQAVLGLPTASTKLTVDGELKHERPEPSTATRETWSTLNSIHCGIIHGDFCSFWDRFPKGYFTLKHYNTRGIRVISYLATKSKPSTQELGSQE